MVQHGPAWPCRFVLAIFSRLVTAPLHLLSVGEGLQKGKAVLVRRGDAASLLSAPSPATAAAQEAQVSGAQRPNHMEGILYSD